MITGSLQTIHLRPLEEAGKLQEGGSSLSRSLRRFTKRPDIHSTASRLRLRRRHINTQRHAGD